MLTATTDTSTTTQTLGEIFTPKALGRMARNRRYCAKEEMAAAAAYLKGFRVWSLVFESGQIVTSEVIPRPRVGRHVAVAACSDLDEWSQSEGIRVAAGRALAHYLKRSRLPKNGLRLNKRGKQWLDIVEEDVINGKPRLGPPPRGFRSLFEEVLIAEHDAEEAQQSPTGAPSPRSYLKGIWERLEALEERDAGYLNDLDELKKRLERLEQTRQWTSGRMTKLAGQTSTKLDGLTERIKHLEHRQAQLMYIQDAQGTRIGQLEDQQATNDPSDRRS